MPRYYETDDILRLARQSHHIQAYYQSRQPSLTPSNTAPSDPPVRRVQRAVDRDADIPTKQEWREYLLDLVWTYGGH